MAGSVFLIAMAVVLVVMVASLILQVLASSHGDANRARRMNTLGSIGLLVFAALEAINPANRLIWRAIFFAFFVLLLVIMFIGHRRRQRLIPDSGTPPINKQNLE